MLHFDQDLLIAGNQAADLDSCVCAFTLAALLKCLNPEINAAPLIQGSAGDLRMKPEVDGLFSRAGIPLKTGHFLEDLNKDDRRSLFTSRSLILVDHNEKDPDLPCLPVMGVVDHHRDSGTCKDAPLRDIRTCGSCASIISEYWRESGEELPYSAHLLLAGAIAVDTGCLNPHWGKTTELDSREYKRLMDLLKPEDRGYIENLLEVKNDLSHLTMTEHLRRDYKSFSVSGLSGGIASLTIRRSDFFSSPFHKGSELKDFQIRNCRDFLMVLHSFGSPLERELSLFDPEGRGKSLKRALALLEERGIRLSEEREEWSFYAMDDPKISRKVLMPLLSYALKKVQ
ncbi:MAG: DHH family phosphoesterase [Spirochaetales bacterium]|nr:DHH family phosphoesterase [Spirochaetales bacterium]